MQARRYDAQTTTFSPEGMNVSQSIGFLSEQCCPSFRVACPLRTLALSQALIPNSV